MNLFSIVPERSRGALGHPVAFRAKIYALRYAAGEGERKERFSIISRDFAGSSRIAESYRPFWL